MQGVTSSYSLSSILMPCCTGNRNGESSDFSFFYVHLTAITDAHNSNSILKPAYRCIKVLQEH